MKVLLYRFLPHVLLLGSAVSSSSNAGLSLRADGSDDLEEWLAAAQRENSDARKRCPISCSKTNDTSSRADWFLYSDAERLAVCNETMLIDMVVQNAEADIEGKVITRACTADYESAIKPAFVAEEEKASLCTTANRVLTNASVYLHQPTASDSEFSNNHLLSAGLQIANHLALQIPSCNHNSMEFAYSQSLAIGLFAGTEVHQHGLTSDVLGKFLEHAQANMISKTTIVQLCGAKGRGADYNIGIVATTAKNLPFVQKAINIWSSGECIPTGANTGEPWMQVTIRTPSLLDEIPGNNTNSTSQRLSDSLANLGRRAHLSIRADCKTAEVQSGDGCSAVASRCGISLSDLEKYNRDNLCNTLVKMNDGTCKTREVVSGDDCTTLPAKCGISSNDFKKANNRGTNFCNNLLEGQQVCCTDGKYPDLKPKPDADGNCATYLTKKDDSCSKIAVARDLNVTDLLDFNRDTWGWNGCKPEVFYPDFLMCVSKGTPPMPAIVPNADCGPTKPDTVKPPSGTNISMLNPCPLNVCCNIWGHCGLSDDFCVVSKSETGAPGTSAPGKNGCVSNCGRDIIKGNAPEKKIKVAYYESWNFNRKCLNMRVTSIPSEYTHIHFAFANVTQGTYKPEITDESTKLEFEDFKKMKNVKKIISFGGWAFSTEPGTFNILREAAQPANRETFKNNLISFMNEHNLDGIDLDWEYPGAPDIPTIPSDDPVNGMNYYRLLSSLKSSVGPDKSVSFAAPASYWYLKAFPIKDMAKALDYIIYMTYDLHGQWDYDNKWTSPGCPTGNCLRSHVNETETKEAPSMITKAGADSGKVVVGVASYGRSFNMEQSGCDSEDCKFTGSPRVSNAYKGRCTDTGGYISNAEIQEIISRGNVQKKYTKEGSNILVFNDTEWVAYMDDEMKASRSKFYDEYNFAGTTDWAIDLQRFWDGDDGSDDDDEEEEINDKYWAACEGQYSTIQQLKDRKDSIPGHCMEQYIADVQVAILDGALKKYKSLVDSDYDKKFSIYEKYVKSQIPGQISNFMASDKVDKYFKCTDYKSVGTCCRDCRFGGSCLDGCIKGADCKGGKGDYPMDKCPKMEFPLKALSTDYIPNATFSFTDESGFYKDISDSFGIDKEWISIGKRHMRTNNGCQYAGKDVNECLEKNSKYFRNYPLASDNIKIFNPKDIIGDSYPKANDMLSHFRDMQVAAVWDEEVVASDMVDAMSLPVLSTEEAVASMEKIVEKANEIEKKEREEMILLFITSVLFFIPFVGNAAGAAGLTAVRTIARLIGSVGDAAITIYDIVKNPEGAFLAVFTYVAGAGVGRGGFRNAANSRRSIPTKDIDGMGNVKTKLNDIDGLRGIMCPI